MGFQRLQSIFVRLEVLWILRMMNTSVNSYMTMINDCGNHIDKTAHYIGYIESTKVLLFD